MAHLQKLRKKDRVEARAVVRRAERHTRKHGGSTMAEAERTARRRAIKRRLEELFPGIIL